MIDVRSVAAVSFALAVSVAVGRANAAPSPSPAPSPSSTAATDPCASLSNVVSRPTFSTSTCAVKPGDLLVETGYSNTATSGGRGTETSSVPEATLRAGIAHNFEVDFDMPSSESTTTMPSASGESDSGFGFKYEIGYSRTLTYGVNVFETLDTGSPAFSANGDGVLANVDAALAMSPAFGFFGSFGYNAQSSGTAAAPQRYHGFDPSLGATLALPQSFNAYVEGFGMSSFAADSGGKYGFDTGITKDIGSRLQLDVEYYDDPHVESVGHQHAVGFGASYLFGP